MSVLVRRSDEVDRLVALAASRPRGRTLEERLIETYAGLRRLVPHVGGNLFSLEPAREQGEVLYVQGIEPRHLSDYVTHYRHSDPMGKFLLGAPFQLKTLSDAASPREIARTEYSDLLGTLGIASVAGWSQPIGAGRLVAVAVHRPRRMPDFTPRERSIVSLVMPLVVAAAVEHIRRPPPLARLTPGERAVVALVLQGLPDRAIVERLAVGFATVRTHLQHAFDKLEVSNRTELVHAIVKGTRRVDDARRDPDARAALAALTAREVEVARLTARGLGDREVARRLGISFPTVRTHLQRAFAKLGITSRTALARLALAAG